MGKGDRVSRITDSVVACGVEYVVCEVEGSGGSVEFVIVIVRLWFVVQVEVKEAAGGVAGSGVGDGAPDSNDGWTVVHVVEGSDAGVA